MPPLVPLFENEIYQTLLDNLIASGKIGYMDPSFIFFAIGSFMIPAFLLLIHFEKYPPISKEDFLKTHGSSFVDWFVFMCINLKGFSMFVGFCLMCLIGLGFWIPEIGMIGGVLPLALIVIAYRRWLKLITNG